MREEINIPEVLGAIGAAFWGGAYLAFWLLLLVVFVVRVVG